MTTANKITIARIVMIPALIVAMLLDTDVSSIIALVIFVVASITDCIDGYLARKHNQITNFGKFLDPLADKLLIMAAILIFVQWGQMPAWAAIIILAREFAVTGLRLVAATGGVVIAAGMSGKIKTVTSILAIILMMTPIHDWVLFGSITVDVVCYVLMVITTVWSGVEYFVKNIKILDVKS